jgi:hypothetical protein
MCSVLRTAYRHLPYLLTEANILLLGLLSIETVEKAFPRATLQ